MKVPGPIATVARITRRGVLRASMVAGLVALLASPATAHVDLAASDPADGSVLEVPVETIELTFTEPARPTGDGILILTGASDPVEATVTRVDDTTLRITPAEPLTGGSFGVGWTVQAGDAHPRSGAITFTVVAAPPSPADAADPASIPRDESEGAGVARSDRPEAPLDPFASLTADPDITIADWLGRVSRAVGLAGALIGIGALVFGKAVPVASSREARRVAFWVRRSGLAILLSLPFELIAQAALLGNGSLIDGAGISSLTATLGGPFGWAMLLRAAGGAGLLWGTGVATTGIAGLAGFPPDAGRSAANVGTAVAARTRHRLDLARSPLAVAASAGLIASFLFDGHTVTASPVWLVRFADVIHVTAAATWAGGVFMLAVILTMRYRAGLPLRAGALALRFSGIASVALGAAGIAGVVLAWGILDSFGEVFTTPWGRVLIAKSVAAGVAAGFGAYNHYVVIPRMSEDEEAASGLIRRTTRIESATLLVVVALTAILVGAAS